MGDIADMMLDGTLCQCCGVALGSDNDYPTSCQSCAQDELQREREEKKAENIAKNARQQKAKCAVCGKKVKIIGMFDHVKDVHGGTP